MWVALMPATSSSSANGGNAGPVTAANAPGRLLDMFTTAAAKSHGMMIRPSTTGLAATT